MSNLIRSRFSLRDTITLNVLTIIFLLFGCINFSMAQWVQVSSGMGNLPVLSSATSGNNIFAGTGGGYGVYSSTNNGTSWTQVSLNNQIVYSLAAQGNNVFAGTFNNGVYYSANNGATWFQTPLNNHNVWSMAVNGNYAFAGTFGLFLSVNNGTSWSQVLFNQYVYSLAANGNNVFAGTGNGVFLSADNGASWSQTTLQNREVDALTVNGDNVYAGAYAYGVFYSPDNGVNWYYTNLNNQNVKSLAVTGNNIFAGTDNNGVFVSNDNGINWIQRNEGLTSFQINSLCILNNYLFAGTNNSVYRRPLAEVIGIKTISELVPAQYSLGQNYPNPFNPSTKFTIQIAKSSDISVTVYNVLGRQVEILVNRQLKPATYEIDWNASNYPSGVYYYKLVAGAFNQTRKMILVK
jgi:Secretion system C-terminal sorting domain